MLIIERGLCPDRNRKINQLPAGRVLAKDRIMPVVVAAGAGGLALQLLLIFLWTIAKNSMH